ncbi:MAG: tetratricopeptide repeat protein [Opitutus sp.]|nr:tetratricopeptide repeat protein [Opitutus sp.]
MSAPPRKGFPFPSLVYALVLATLAFVVYWPSLHGEFLWDDPAHVTRVGLQSWNGLWRIWFEFGATQEFYPVLHSAFWVQHRFWGDATTPYHVVNVLLHVTNGVLLALLVRRIDGLRERPLFRSALPAWLAGAVFVLHPVAVESVAWVTEQKNTLSTAFLLASAFVFFRFWSERRRRDYALAFFLFFMALGAKTATVVLPPALLVVIWWIRGRIEWSREIRPLVAFFLLAFVAGALTVWFESSWVGAQGSLYALSLDQRTLLAARVVWFYLGKLVWPADVTFFYPRWDLPAETGRGLFCLGAALAFTAALWLFRRRLRGPLAAWLLFAGVLFPVMGFFNVYAFAFSYVADHFQYLAIPVFAGAVIVGAQAGLSALAPRVQWLGGRVPLVASLIVLAIYGVNSQRLSGHYVNNETLFRANIATNPQSWMGHHILASAVGKDPARLEESLALYRRALELRRDNYESNYKYGYMLAQAGRAHEAIPHYREALRIRPHYPEAHNSLGVALLDVAQPEEAVKHFEEALRQRPRFGLALSNLAIALSRIPGREQDAVARFEEVLRLMPEHTPSHFHFGVLLSRLPGRAADAVQHFEIALAADPTSAETQYYLGTTLVAAGRVPDALRVLGNAVRMHPNDSVLRAHLGATLALLPERRSEALAQFREALRIDPRQPWVQFNYALQLFQSDAIVEAKQAVQTALKLHADYTDALNLLGVILASEGNVTEARHHWRRALEIDPAYEPARRNLARVGE